MMYIIPLTPEPQSFFIALAGRRCRLTVKWSDAPEGGWLLDLDDSGGASVLTSLPLITGADLLGQYGHLELGGMIWCFSPDDLPPDAANLGSEIKLIFEVINV